MVLDSNIVIYAAEPDGGFLDEWVESPSACLSTVSRIEVLGFPRWDALDEGRRARLESLINGMPELALDSRVAERAIELRREKKMSLGDSIIAATALIYQMPLVTRNSDDFKHIAGLQIINPFTGEADPHADDDPVRE